MIVVSSGSELFRMSCTRATDRSRAVGKLTRLIIRYYNNDIIILVDDSISANDKRRHARLY